MLGARSHHPRLQGDRGTGKFFASSRLALIVVISLRSQVTRWFELHRPLISRMFAGHSSAVSLASGRSIPTITSRDGCKCVGSKRRMNRVTAKPWHRPHVHHPRLCENERSRCASKACTRSPVTCRWRGKDAYCSNFCQKLGSCFTIGLCHRLVTMHQ